MIVEEIVDEISTDRPTCGRPDRRMLIIKSDQQSLQDTRHLGSGQSVCSYQEHIHVRIEGLHDRGVGL